MATDQPGGTTPDEPPADPLDSIDDRDLLSGFALAVLDDFETLVELREILFLVAAGRTDPDSVRMIRELGRLQEELPRRRDVLIAGLEGLQPHDARLAMRGLDGVPLRAKLASWRGERTRARRLFDDSDDDVPRARRMLWQVPPPAPFPDLRDTFGPPIPMKLPRQPGAALRAIERVAGPASTILGSLSDLVPGASFLGEGIGVLGQVAGSAASHRGRGPGTQTDASR